MVIIFQQKELTGMTTANEIAKSARDVYEKIVTDVPTYQRHQVSDRRLLVTELSRDLDKIMK